MKTKDTIHGKLKSLLSSNANTENAEAMQSYMKEIAPFYGVKSPLRKTLFNEAFAACAPTSVNELEEQCLLLMNEDYRELHYSAMELFYRKRRWWNENSLDTIEKMLTIVPWWDTIDFMAKNLVGYYVQRYPRKGMAKCREWNKSDQMWLVRTSILFQLGYKEKTNTDWLSEFIEPHLEDNEFFIRKAIGWSLRQYGKFNPMWVREYVQNHQLTPLSKKEALKHIG